MTIRVIELFAGIGAQAAALERLGLDHECIAVAEIDERAYRGYCAIHGDVPNLGDVTKIEHLPECDLLTYSFPCLGAGTLIQTEKGWKPIEDVAVGDRVWTDDGWRRVTKSMMTGIKRTYRIKPSFGLEIRATGNHPFLVRRMHRKWNADRHSYDRLFSEPEWVPAEELTRNMYLGYRIPDEGPIPDYGGYREPRSDGRIYTYDSLTEYIGDPRFWWTVGRYIADGYIRTDGCAVLCIGKGKERDADNIPFHYTASQEPTCLEAVITKQEFGRFASQFGEGAPNKRIPPEYRNLPIPLATAMLDGYLSGDGSYKEKSRLWDAATVSPSLALDIAQLVAYVHGRPSSIYVTHREPTCVIEGRTVNQRDSINVRFHEDDRTQDKSFCEDGWVWTKIASIGGEGEEEPVYDLEVEDRHCFTANNVIVHNCTDISMAGKREGMEEGSGTRSSLLWEVGRFLDDYQERGCLPEVLLMENVDAILFKANMPGFQRWMDRLEKMGYTNSYQVLNAKDYGVPQNRKRCFLVSTRTLGKLVFPKPIPLDRRLKDVLEKDVPESFYLSPERLATFERHKKRQQDNGTGFGYKPRDPDGDSERERVSNSITTYADRYVSTWIDETPKSEGRGDPGQPEGADVIRTRDLNNGSAQNGVVYSPDGVSPALMASAGEKGNHVRIDVSENNPGIEITGHITGQKYEQGQRVYGPDGISPAMCARDYKEPAKVEVSGSEPGVEVIGDLNNPRRLDQHNRVYGSEGVSPTLYTPHGCDAAPKIEEPRAEVEQHDIRTIVKVRVHEPDKDGLVSMLRDAKDRSGKSIKRIAEEVGCPVTEAEHWFRTDDGWSIPNPDLWPKVKESLGLGDSEYDQQITDFEERESEYDMGNRAYGTEGIAPTLKTGSTPKILSDPGNGSGTIVEGSLDIPGRYESALRVYGTEGTAPTLPTGGGGGIMPKILEPDGGGESR